jgi:hypothetical protein
LTGRTTTIKITSSPTFPRLHPTRWPSAAIDKDGNVPQVRFNEDGKWHDLSRKWHDLRVRATGIIAYLLGEWHYSTRIIAVLAVEE